MKHFTTSLVVVAAVMAVVTALAVAGSSDTSSVSPHTIVGDQSDPVHWSVWSFEAPKAGESTLSASYADDDEDGVAGSLGLGVLVYFLVSLLAGRLLAIICKESKPATVYGPGLEQPG